MKECNLCIEFDDTGFVRIPLPNSITRFLLKEFDCGAKPIDIYFEEPEEDY